MKIKSEEISRCLHVQKVLVQIEQVIFFILALVVVKKGKLVSPHDIGNFHFSAGIDHEYST